MKAVGGNRVGLSVNIIMVLLGGGDSGTGAIRSANNLGFNGY